MPEFAPAGAGKQRGAHAFERVRHRDEPGEDLQRLRQNGDRIHHSADESRDAEVLQAVFDEDEELAMDAIEQIQQSASDEK